LDAVLEDGLSLHGVSHALPEKGQRVGVIVDSIPFRDHFDPDVIDQFDKSVFI
jgi:hypothetical protein